VNSAQNQFQRRHERGVSTLEYAIMLALVALAVALATNNIRDGVLGVFEATLTIINTP
jgi:Flp pilus assembly pilin Flp